MRAVDAYYQLYPHLRRARDFAERQAGATGADSQLLSGLCACASAFLSHELSKFGLVHRIAVAERAVSRRDQEAHVYVLCGQHILDVTASQFGHPDLVVRPRTAAEAEWYWQACKTFDCPMKLHRWQRATSWPHWQVVPLHLAERWRRERWSLAAEHYLNSRAVPPLNNGSVAG